MFNGHGGVQFYDIRSKLMMKDIYVIYWSGRGNTETMALPVVDGIDKAGGILKQVSDVIPDILKDENFALGCPAMGTEEVEEGEMEIGGVNG